MIKFLLVVFWTPVFAWYMATGSEASVAGLIAATLTMAIIFVEDKGRFC